RRRTGDGDRCQEHTRSQRARESPHHGSPEESELQRGGQGAVNVPRPGNVVKHPSRLRRSVVKQILRACGAQDDILSDAKDLLLNQRRDVQSRYAGIPARMTANARPVKRGSCHSAFPSMYSVATMKSAGTTGYPTT